MSKKKNMEHQSWSYQLTSRFNTGKQNKRTSIYLLNSRNLRLLDIYCLCPLLILFFNSKQDNDEINMKKRKRFLEIFFLNNPGINFNHYLIKAINNLKNMRYITWHGLDVMSIISRDKVYFWWFNFIGSNNYTAFNLHKL